MAELGLLEEGEILCEVEGAGCDGGSRGLLAVTDLNVFFVRRPLLRRSTFVLAIPLDEIECAEVFESDAYFKRMNRGALAVLRRLTGGQVERREFDGVLGGRERAEQIVGTILQQKAFLESNGTHPGRVERASVEVAADLEDTSVDASSPVVVGRGVVKWVAAHGGRLYVWGDPFGNAFDTMKASNEPPDGVEFVRTGAVTEFDLYVEAGMSWRRPIRLGRRWFGLRDGIVVDTGLVGG